MGILGKSLDLVLVYKFLRGLTTPFEDTEAYELGIIDEDGNILKKRRTLSPQEKDAYTLFDRVVWKFKRLLEKIPFGRSKIVSYAAAAWFLKENEQKAAIQALDRYQQTYNVLTEELKDCKDALETGFYVLSENIYNLDDEVIAESGSTIFIDSESFLDVSGIRFFTAISEDNSNMLFPVSLDSLNLNEEAPTMSAGSGGIAGIGVGDDGEPGMFAGCKKFQVKPEIFHRCIRGKHPRHRYSKYVDDDDLGEEIRQYGRANPKKGIVIQNSFTGEMVYLRRG